MNVTRLAIIGVGLIGGSLGLALKARMGDSVSEVVRDADIVFLSPPVLQIVPMVEKILPFLKKGTIITDAGSTKQYVYDRLREMLPPDIYYIAGHPMTGREKSGVAAADKDLFVGKAYVIVEDTGAPKEAHEKLMSVLRHTGASFTTLDIAKHDRCASVISHVPHVTAAALVTLLNRSGSDLESCIKLIGGGFKDTTRIASSNADMWADICMTNGEAIANHLRELQGILGEVIDSVEKGDRQALYDYFLASKERRDSLLEKSTNLFDTN